VKIKTRWFPTVLTTCAAIAQADVRNPVAELGVEWGGIRSALSDSGVDVHIGYVRKQRATCRAARRNCGAMPIS
jgi:carbohydrate-selective porin OprB